MSADGGLFLGENAAEGEDAPRGDRFDEIVGVDAKHITDNVGQHDVSRPGELEALFEAGVVEGHTLVSDAVVLTVGDTDADRFGVAIEASDPPATQLGGG